MVALQPFLAVTLFILSNPCTTLFVKALPSTSSAVDTTELASSSELVPKATCDPCDESCLDDAALVANLPRLVYANDTTPWDEDEASRWVITEVEDHLGKRQQLMELRFNCMTVPEICNNMCYGAMCLGLGFDLTVNRVQAACRAARQRNLCGSANPNYCSNRAPVNFPAGYSCDEYPFASTTQGQTGTQTATRCVLRGQNSSQGGTISAFYRNGTSPLPDGTRFRVVLMNTAGLTNCQNYPAGPANCNKDATVSGMSQRP